eukprot:SAG31_NODE_7309_length_1723_cov_6.340285_2_plen_81_part_00
MECDIFLNSMQLMFLLEMSYRPRALAGSGENYRQLLHLYILQTVLEAVQNSSFIAASEALLRIGESETFKSVSTASISCV